MRIVIARRELELNPNRTDLSFRQQLEYAVMAPKKSRRLETGQTHIYPSIWRPFVRRSWAIEVKTETSGTVREQPIIYHAAPSPLDGKAYAQAQMSFPIIELKAGDIVPLGTTDPKTNITRARTFIVVDRNDSSNANEISPIGDDRLVGSRR